MKTSANYGKTTAIMCLSLLGGAMLFQRAQSMAHAAGLPRRWWQHPYIKREWVRHWPGKKRSLWVKLNDEGRQRVWRLSNVAQGWARRGYAVTAAPPSAAPFDLIGVHPGRGEVVLLAHLGEVRDMETWGALAKVACPASWRRIAYAHENGRRRRYRLGRKGWV